MLSLRPANSEDSATLLAWRNDPQTRDQSINADAVLPAAHEAWLLQSLASASRVLLIAETDGVPVGTVRLDKGAETELSWTVAPDWRGKGIGQAMIALAVRCIDSPIVARIKSANVPSQRIAARAGFVLRQDGAVQIWEREAGKP